MKSLRPEEEWARSMMSRALGVPVVQHDDGSAPRMHDLAVHNSDGTSGAVEITAAADSEAIELWNLVNGRDERWIVPELDGGWMITLVPAARAKRVIDELPDLLLDLERRGMDGFGRHRPRIDDVFGAFRDLGVIRAHQGGTDFPGSIYVTLERDAEFTGGFVADTGDAVGPWLGEFLGAPDRRDVLDKLRRSGAVERHAFVLLPGFAAAPFPVTDLLMRPDAPLPSLDPTLPPEVTHVWLASGWSMGRGFRWAPESGWAFFEKFENTPFKTSVYCGCAIARSPVKPVPQPRTRTGNRCALTPSPLAGLSRR